MVRGGPKEKRSDLWEHKVEIRGATVVAYERKPGGNLYVRYFDSRAGNWVPKSLGHTDRAKAKAYAKTLAGDLLRGVRHDREGELTVGHLLLLYDMKVSRKKKGQQPKEDARRRDIWEAFLGPDCAWSDVDFDRVDEFVEARRAGTIQVARKLKPNPSDSTIGADIIYLQSVFNWAATRRRRGKAEPGQKAAKLIPESPIEGYDRPFNSAPARTWATYDWYLAARPFAAKVDAAGIFVYFLDLLETMGWRVSALCELRVSDLALERIPNAPFGAIHKRGETDKEGVDMWVPLPEVARAAIDAVLRKRQAVGNAYLFPAPRSKKRGCYDRHYVDQRLYNIARAAGLPQISAHAFRRKWEEERRHLPEKDRMDASGRKDVDTMRNSYLRRDQRRVLAVMQEPTKLRAEDVGGLSATQNG